MTEFLTKLSTVPFIFLIQIFAIEVAAKRAVRLRKLHSPGFIHALLLVLVAWAVCVAGLALYRVLTEPLFLESYPLVWMPFVPVVLMMVSIAPFPEARHTVRVLIDVTPMHWITAIQALRILALGTIVKASRGEFSMPFAAYVGGPDLLFGLSALLVTWLVVNKCIGIRGLVAWNCLGILVIIPGAPLIGQMELWGLLYGMEKDPLITALFEFPLVLAPALVVPVFVMMNVLVAIRLFERLKAAGRTLSERGTSRADRNISH